MEFQVGDIVIDIKVPEQGKGQVLKISSIEGCPCCLVRFLQSKGESWVKASELKKT